MEALARLVLEMLEPLVAVGELEYHQPLGFSKVTLVSPLQPENADVAMLVLPVITTVFSEVAEKRGVKIFIPPVSLCGDNAAMIAAAGYFEFIKGKRADTSLNASANDD